MDEDDLIGWDTYYGNWARRHVTPDIWDRLKWQYSGGMVPKMELVIAELRKNRT